MGKCGSGGGGYRLARDPARITVGDIVRAVEGPVAMVECVLAEGEEKPACDRADRCVTHLLWTRISEAVTDMLNGVTLQDLADQTQMLSGL